MEWIIINQTKKLFLELVRIFVSLHLAFFQSLFKKWITRLTFYCVFLLGESAWNNKSSSSLVEQNLKHKAENHMMQNILTLSNYSFVIIASLKSIEKFFFTFFFQFVCENRTEFWHYTFSGQVQGKAKTDSNKRIIIFTDFKNKLSKTYWLL